MQRFGRLLASLFALGGTCAAAQGVSEEITIASWNVQHFVDTVDNPYVEHDQDEEHVKSEAQLAAIAETLRALDADVLALQEVEGSDWVRAFLEERAPGLGYAHIVSAPDDNWHQNVVIASRLPLGPMTSMTAAATSVEGEETSFINDRLLAVEVYPPGWPPLLVQAVHLKAGTGPRNESWREGQAAHLRGWLDGQLRLRPDLLICILGDFNATPDETSMRLWTEPAEGPVYHNLFAAAGDPPTFPAWEPERAIDRILVNDALRAHHVEGSALVFTEIGPAEGRRCSDHLPVAARFALSP
ncbi:MAG: endonuclease/exonuclease/phosphatase family protein [Candidatus Sumerlaeia bacterium]|nr:endonuclease/exonuclease/phosphatase family protein [Candidatus Sumerlaeia bacterium]